MNIYFSEYELQGGVFTSHRIHAPAPPSARAGFEWLPGLYDPSSQRVDLQTGQVVDYQPPKPDDTTLATYVWSVEARRWEAVPTLAALQASKWEAIKAARNTAEASGFAWDGSTFDSDLQSQSRIQGAVQLALLAASAAQAFEIDWTLADNTVRTLGGNEMIAVGLALAAHVQAVFDQGRALRESVFAATSAEDLSAISWSP